MVYDLYTGTILGVLRLDNKTEDAVQCSRSTMSIHTGVLGVTETPGIPLVSGGDMLAVAPTAVTVKVSAPVGLVNHSVTINFLSHNRLRRKIARTCIVVKHL